MRAFLYTTRSWLRYATREEKWKIFKDNGDGAQYDCIEHRLAGFHILFMFLHMAIRIYVR